MDKAYIYRHHQGFDIFISRTEKTRDELYCEQCEQYDEPLAVCDTVEGLVETFRSIRRVYDLVPGLYESLDGDALASQSGFFRKQKIRRALRAAEEAGRCREDLMRQENSASNQQYFELYDKRLAVAQAELLKALFK